MPKRAKPSPQANSTKSKKATSGSYAATIEGRSEEVQGFDNAHNLVLADRSRYTLECLNPQSKPPTEPGGELFDRPLLEVARLRRDNGEWFLNDEPLIMKQWRDATATKRATLPARALACFILESKLEGLEANGVAWFKQDDGAGGWNTPILLKSFRPLPFSNIASVEATNSVPDYFTSIKGAAAYAKKTERTIFNWKKRDWLKVEQNGKKIRIAKTDLDKCKSRQ